MSSANPSSIQNNEKVNTTVNPATGEQIEEYGYHSADQANDIVEKSHRAFLHWRETSMAHRSKIIHGIAETLEKNKEELAKLMAKEMGKPVTQGRMEVDRCINICKYTADEDYKNLADEERSLKDGKKGIIAYQPIGVILGIQPWNFPLYQVIRYAVPNLMAGNAVLLKHAKNVWGMAKRCKELLDHSDLPDGLFGVLYLDNNEVNDLIGHEKIRGVTLTGSSKAGKAVASTAGKHLKKSVLELGGSDPYIILEDVDLDKAVEICVKGRINNAGQTCVAAKRFIIIESIYDEFRDKFIQAMESVEYGDPLKVETQMGPLAREDLRDKLQDQVQKSIEEEAICILGGTVPAGDGYFYPASILENIKPGTPAYDDELFGPVACLFKVKNEDEAIKIANDHRYGLGGGVMSGNEDRAIELAKKIDTGMVSINGYFGSQPNLPFGGVKESGYGREHGGFGIKEFTNIKSIMVGE